MAQRQLSPPGKWQVLHSAGRTLSKFSAVSQGCSSRSYCRTKLAKASSQTPPSVSDSLPYWGFLGSPPKWTACIQSLSQSPFMENTRHKAGSWLSLKVAEQTGDRQSKWFSRLHQAVPLQSTDRIRGWTGRGVRSPNATHPQAPPRSRKNDLNSDTAVCIEAGKEYGEHFYWSYTKSEVTCLLLYLQLLDPLDLE